MPAEFSSDRLRIQRFLREARIAASLTHPNILSLFEIGEEGGVNFLAMEYLAGCTLRDELKGAPMDLGRALHIGRQVSEALGVAHAAGIVHRDIKPENIFLLTGDHPGIKGLARSKGRYSDCLCFCPPSLLNNSLSDPCRRKKLWSRRCCRNNIILRPAGMENV